MINENEIKDLIKILTENKSLVHVRKCVYEEKDFQVQVTVTRDRLEFLNMKTDSKVNFLS